MNKATNTARRIVLLIQWTCFLYFVWFALVPIIFELVAGRAQRANISREIWNMAELTNTSQYFHGTQTFWVIPTGPQQQRGLSL